MYYCELKKKEVINTVDGRSLGYVTDFVFDVCCGKILSVIVSVPFKFSFFGGSESLCICWQDICKIGSDVILVKIDPSHLQNR